MGFLRCTLKCVIFILFRNTVTLSNIARDYAEHPCSWLHILPRPLPAVQAIPETCSWAQMEREGCRHRLVQVNKGKRKWDMLKDAVRLKLPGFVYLCICAVFVYKS